MHAYTNWDHSTVCCPTWPQREAWSLPAGEREAAVVAGRGVGNTFGPRSDSAAHSSGCRAAPPARRARPTVPCTGQPWTDTEQTDWFSPHCFKQYTQSFKCLMYEVSWGCLFLKKKYISSYNSFDFSGRICSTYETINQRQQEESIFSHPSVARSGRGIRLHKILLLLFLQEKIFCQAFILSICIKSNINYNDWQENYPTRVALELWSHNRQSLLYNTWHLTFPEIWFM